MITDDLNLISKLDEQEQHDLKKSLKNISPDDAKYASKSKDLSDYLSAEAEWKACAKVQFALMDTRYQFGLADEKNAREVYESLKKIVPANMGLIEGEVTKHDQLAVIDEIGRFVSEETKSLLHPGTTSYDILDTARSYLLKEGYYNVFRPATEDVVNNLLSLSCDYSDVLQVGRTHLQRTSPIIMGNIFSGYAARIAERVYKLDLAVNDLRGKISGIVGTGASIDQVIGDGKSREFEREVLIKLDLEPDITATQIVQKERLSDVGHGIVSLMYVLGDLANDMRLLYASDINEVTSRSGEKRLGGSSADASKNNPINWENICGKVPVVEGGMRVLYSMIQSDLQRDLRSSVQARYQPASMIAQTYESLRRASKALKSLSVNEDVVAENLQSVRDFPSEAMLAIMRGHGFIHPKYGIGHSTVKELSKIAKNDKRPIMEVAHEDEHFAKFYQNLPEDQKEILSGNLEKYLGHAKDDRHRHHALVDYYFNKFAQDKQR